jgi:hypothetical protein
MAAMGLGGRRRVGANTARVVICDVGHRQLQWARAGRSLHERAAVDGNSAHTRRVRRASSSGHARSFRSTPTAIPSIRSASVSRHRCEFTLTSSMTGRPPARASGSSRCSRPRVRMPTSPSIRALITHSTPRGSASSGCQTWTMALPATCGSRAWLHRVAGERARRLPAEGRDHCRQFGGRRAVPGERARSAPGADEVALGTHDCQRRSLVLAQRLRSPAARRQIARAVDIRAHVFDQGEVSRRQVG